MNINCFYLIIIFYLIFQRSLATLRNILAHSTDALNQACDQKIHIHIMRILKVKNLHCCFQLLLLLSMRLASKLIDCPCMLRMMDGCWCKLVFVQFNPQLVILSSHFQVGWGASTRETVKKYAIKSLALCTMERKDAREAVLSEKGTLSLSMRVALLSDLGGLEFKPWSGSTLNSKNISH